MCPYICYRSLFCNSLHIQQLQKSTSGLRKCWF